MKGNYRLQYCYIFLIRMNYPENIYKKQVKPTKSESKAKKTLPENQEALLRICFKKDFVNPSFLL